MLLRRHRVARARTKPIAPLIENNENSTANDDVYTKTDVSRMNLENLKILAAELGIEATEELTGKELKTVIIEKLGL